MTAQPCDAQDDQPCRACDQSADDHDDSECPLTRVPGFAKRGLGRRPRRKPDFIDVAFPESDQWDTSGFPFCWGAGAHSDYCGCRPLTPSTPQQDKDVS